MRRLYILLFLASISIADAQLTLEGSLPATGMVGTPYSGSLSAKHGVPPYSFAISSGALPGGVSMSSDGQVSGVPSVAGLFHFSVKVTDSNSRSASGSFTVAISAAPLRIATTSPLPAGTVGVAYSQGLTASGGTPPYRWSGSAPDGLTLAMSGSITGTPSTAGNFSFTATVNDSASGVASRSFSITISPAPLTITTTSPLPNGTAGVAYSQGLSASGGTPPYRWSGSAPDGLTLGPDGSITGIPTAPGNFSFTATVNDSASGSATRTFAITINPSTLTITTTSPLPSGAVGVAYSQGLSASGGTPPYRWSGSAPDGLTLGPDGSITGTPTAPGNFSFTATVNDSASGTANRSFAITINPAAVTITTTSPLPSGTVGVAYSQGLSASGGTPPYRWSGSAPDGLTLGTDGSVTGTPTAPGNFSFTATVNDSASGTANRTFAITINPSTLTITSTSPLPNGAVGVAYSQGLSASGGTPPYRWSGSAPDGLTLGTDGSVTGTPSAPGNFSFTATVNDSASGTANRTFAITINPSTLTITSTSPLPSGTAGVAYSQGLTASGGTPPYQWSGSAPDGLTLGANGSITGIPTAPGNFSIAATVNDSASGIANRTFTIAINATALTITTGALPGATLGITYTQSLSASGGTPPYRWSGTAPAGLVLGPDGSITGSPGAAGKFNFQVTVTDSAGAVASKQLLLTVNATGAPLSITTPSLLSSVPVRTAYTQTLSGTGGAPPYIWSVISGTLPGGINLSTDGTLTGSPTSVGTFGFTVQLNDSTSLTTSKFLILTVTSGLIITTAPSLPAGEVGSNYSQTLGTAAGIPPLTWSIAAGAVPTGLSIDGSKGTIAGVPGSSGSYNFTAQAKDSTGAVAVKQFTLTIAAALTITTAPVLSDASAGATYSQPLVATGGIPPLSWSVTAGQLPPGLNLDPAGGAISGTASAPGSFNFTIQVSDSNTLQASKAFSISVVPGLTISTAAALPDATAGASYTQALAASGGQSPYTWSIESGSLAPGLALDPSSGQISGVATSPGMFTFTAQVNDAAGSSATKQFTITVGSSLTITTGAVLPASTAGMPYSVSLTAAGGVAPYNWALGDGSLPDGLALDQSSGLISGMPGVVGTFAFSIQITDTSGAISSQQFSLSVGAPPLPALSLDSVPGAADAAEQVTLNLSSGGAYPLPITGTVTLRFLPDPAVGADDPAIQFSTGGRSVSFVIPSNSTQPVPPLALQTGTVAGTIELDFTIQGAPEPDLSRTITIARSAPTIRNVKLVNNTGGFELQVTGFSTTREVAQATVQFAGSGLQTSQLAVPLSSVAGNWYQSAASQPYGSQFSLALPFTIQGSQDAIQAVTLTITNGQGDSTPVRVDF